MTVNSADAHFPAGGETTLGDAREGNFGTGYILRSMRTRLINMV